MKTTMKTVKTTTTRMMTMTDELVNRLRAIDHLSVEDCFCQSALYDQAADRIEALTAERDALIAQRDAVPFDINAMGMTVEMAAQSTIRIVTKERDEALADNAWLRKSCECAMSEIRDYMQEVGETLPLSLAMGWLSAALNTGKDQP
jgi:hypothetical protein